MKFFQYYDEAQNICLGFCHRDVLADAQASVAKSGAQLPITLTDVLNSSDHAAVLDAYQELEPVAIAGDVSFAPAVSEPEKLFALV